MAYSMNVVDLFAVNRIQKYTTDGYKLKNWNKKEAYKDKPAYSRLVERNEYRLIHLVLYLHKYTTYFISFHDHSTVGRKVQTRLFL